MEGRFDFTPAQSGEMSPARKEGYIFAPLEEARARDTSGTSWWAVLFLLGLLGGIFLAAIIQRYRQRHDHHREIEQWRNFQRLLHERGLAAKEIAALLQTVRAAAPESPEQAVLFPEVFDAKVAAELTKRFGDKVAQKLRDRIFGGAVEPAGPPAFKGTKEFGPGEIVRLHFSGYDGTYHCPVIGASVEGFVVALPLAGGRHITPGVGEKVEGYVDRGRLLYQFATTVRELLPGGAFACRLAHTDRIEELSHRDEARVNVTRAVFFGHVGAEDAPAGANEGVSASRVVAQWEGVFRDLSMGGCAIATQAPAEFKPGDLVVFPLQILNDEPPQNFTAKIVQVSPGQTEDEVVLHSHFLGLSPEARGCLARSIFRIRMKENS